MNKQQTPRKERNVGLDLLRISLALLIFMFHSNMHFDCHYGVFDHFVRYGAIAMTGFFMMSGYVLNFSNKQLLTDIGTFKKFILKRFISILPLYYFVAGAYIIFFHQESWLSVLLLFPFEVLGLQSCFTSLFGISHNGGTWFISCLVICYFLFPFIQWLLLRISKRERIIIGGGILLILFLAPIVKRHFNLASIYTNPFFRVLEFIMGVLAYMLSKEVEIRRFGELFKSKSFMLLLILLFMVCVSEADYLMVERDYMLMNWIVIPFFLVLLPLLSYHKFSCLGNNKLISWLSGLSYAFFLVQFFVWPLSYHTSEYWIGIDSNIVRVFVSLTYCIVLADLLNRFVEKPIKKYFIH